MLPCLQQQPNPTVSFPAMSPTMTARDLNLCLQAGADVPCHRSWRIEDGYLRISSFNHRGDPFTLSPVRLHALSAAQVEEAHPTPEEREAFLLQQCLQTSTLLRLSRTRPAESRLFQLLLWMGERFGRVSRRGVSLSLEDMNLTHRHLAEISGLTRVTVTKALSHFRQAGFLIQEGTDALLIQATLPSLQTAEGESSFAP
jgi:hypothetical protein